MNIVFGILTFALIVIALFLIFVVLMQKSKDGGVGAALGGGMAEATFGAETGNVLTKATINAAIALFVLSFALYMGRIYQANHASGHSVQLPYIAAPASAPASLPPIAAPLPKPATP